ncbi:Uu.00g088790.m01.CDS01 [Anthostomella pinea]|uniref:Uu.00g088790.m01.CDS01 n=1 Tax=Anthostomella pinea TaxID=933095 RepID=A0AAI8VMP1_9PEZI|nr:Uu.00g088790.m01.CDS01 [Anthostomella pinea]
MQAIKLYPTMIVWSTLFSAAIALGGYNLVLISSFFAFPHFAQEYSLKRGVGQLPDPGSMATERFGLKKTLLGTSALLIGLIFTLLFAQKVQTLLFGAIVIGVLWGVF